MDDYTSDRVYSGTRLLKAEQAAAHRRRALAALERQAQASEPVQGPFIPDDLPYGGEGA